MCLHGETTSVFSLSDATTRRTVLRRYGRLGSPRGVRRGAREAWCDWDRAEGGDGGHRRTSAQYRPASSTRSYGSSRKERVDEDSLRLLTIAKGTPVILRCWNESHTQCEFFGSRICAKRYPLFSERLTCHAFPARIELRAWYERKDYAGGHPPPPPVRF